ncbi:MAG TPA: carboxypeptidase-like regulatory domain-containing protein [Bacteroidales bacterium]|nr:carboxypeptidase-like regulatory domain-containing protein [Bacteroidales bacterium]
MDTTKSPGSIFGKVIDFHTKQPISDLKVTLENSRSIIQSVTTDVNGFYTFNPVYPGLYTLELSNNKCNVKQKYRYYFPDSNSSNLLNLTFNCINHSYNKNYYDSNASGNIRVRGNRNDGQTTIIDGVRVSSSSSIVTSTTIEREELNRTPCRSVSASNESTSNQIYSYTPVVRSGGSSRNTNSGNVNQQTPKS